MRKLCGLLLALIMLLSLVACGGEEPASAVSTPESVAESETDSEPVDVEESEPVDSEEESTSEAEGEETTADEEGTTTADEEEEKTTKRSTTKTTKRSTTKTSKKTTTKKTTEDTTERTTETTTTAAEENWEKPMTDYTAKKYTDYITYRTPLTNTYNKLTKDKELTVVYFGGSLTSGYGCTNRDKYSWRALSGEWLKEQFPDANITTVDTAIGESGTYLGTYRVQKDVIGSKPDLLFIEYAINDTYSRAGQQVAAMRFETIVREVREALPYCDIVTVLTTDKSYMAKSKNGLLFPTAQGHSDIAAAYDLPVVNIGAGLANGIAKSEKNDTWWTNDTIWKTYFVDTVHPNNKGHKQYYLCMEEYLENSLLGTDYTGFASVKRTLPAVVSDHLLDGNRQSITGEKLQTHFVADKSNGAAYNAGKFNSSTSQTPHIGYYEIKASGEVTFTFDGTEFAVWTDLYQPAELTYSVDGGAQKTITCDDHAPTEVVADLEPGEHTITLKASAAWKIGALFTRDASKQTEK